MQLLYESKFQVLLYSEKDNMFINEWKKTTEDFSEDSYLVELHKLFSYFRRLKPLRYYCDTTHIGNHLSREAQEFTANLFRHEKARYCAVVTTKRDISPSVEGVITELEIISEDNDFTNRYFQDRNTAMNWLLSCGSGPISLRNSREVVSQQ